MKTIGMIGGLSWESTATYYRLLNEGVKEALGGLHSAQLLLYSFDFDEIEQLQMKDAWAESAVRLAEVAKSLEQGGAEMLIICTNTMHRVADEVEAAIGIPLLHIADASGQQLTADGIKKAGLLGTRFTMEQDFYRARLQQNFGIEVLIPPPASRETVHRIIYEELCKGIFSDDSRKQCVDIIRDLASEGAEAVILGCTELPLLVKPEHTPTPVYDTTAIHAEKALAMALK